ncbi:hypothetical protein ACHAQJ_004715 [Trichoderma viride]
MAASALRNAFAKVITDRSEGLVLKADQPYFNFSNDKRPFTNHCIKLKKDYIGRFGEVGDFAVVGAGFNAAKARTYNIDNLKWTHFYVGCIDNREEVRRWNATPEFTVINVVELSEAMLKTFISYANPKPVPAEGNVETKLMLAAGAQTVPMTVAFTDPPVFDLRCFNFDKAGSTNWWSLRFPSVAKIHFDRDFSDVLSFDELQKIADDAMAAPELEDSRDNLAWIARLEQADPRGLAVDAATQLTATTMPTPSPRRASHNSSGSLSLIRQATEGSLERSVEFLGTSVSQFHRLAASQPSPTTNFSKKSLLPGNRRKRAAFSPTLLCPTNKRHKPSVDETSGLELPSRESEFESPTRRPLGEINGNSAQRPQTSTSPPNNCPPKSQNQSISNHPVDNQGEEKDSNGQESAADKLMDSSSSLLPLHDSAIVIPDSEDDDETDSDATNPSSPLACTRRRDGDGKDDKKRPNQDSAETGTSCQYAGPECQLANRLVLLPLYFSDLEEVKPLLLAHGLLNIVRDAEGWIKKNTADVTLLLEDQTGPNKILFVDSVEKEVETKALLSKLEDIRESIPEERREWISVFDWRVLNHLTIYEDEKDTKKYYDGFHDPWRRWYCGLV